MSRALTVPEGQEQPDLLSQYLGNLGLPAFILTTLAPGLFGRLAKYPRAVRLLTIPLVLWLASNFLVNKIITLWKKIMSNAMSSVTITSDDFYLYAAFKSWLSKQKMMMLEKAISAQSVFYLRNKGQDGRTIEKELANNKSIVFDPQNKFQLFRHNGRLFLLTMDTRQMMHTPTDRTEMKVWCLGLSPEPIENLLLEIYDSSRSQDSRTLTTIMTPYGGRQWNRRCIKPARPLSSVYLQPEEKNRLISDMEEYLNPKTAKWYQNRGIPYRRGYLFHGCPGCGKTSLAVALAGHFKLDVYIVSLLDLEISDSALLQLFQAVRSGVLVLLEDVDSAGLGREVQENSADAANGAIPALPFSIAEKRKAKLQSSRITLSGLLNAIDGAGAPEGHILVMTTNTPDALDEALVRPGRVDVKVEFSKATRGQVREIFVNMYRPTIDFETKVEKASDQSQKDEIEIEKEGQESVDAKELDRLADEFAERVPEKKFSPAELQDYILLRKDQPQRAVEEIGAWVEKGLRTMKIAESKGSTADEKAKMKKVRGKKGKKTALKDSKAQIEEVTAGKDAEQQTKEPEHEQEHENNVKVDESVSPTNPASATPSTGSDSDDSSDQASDDGESPASSVGEEAEGEEEVAEKGVEQAVTKKELAKEK